MIAGFEEMEFLGKVKTALRIRTCDFDDEISDLIEAAIEDLKIAGVNTIKLVDPLIKRAVITYCRLNFGNPVDPTGLKASYDEQKAQLKVSSGYTEWGEDDG